MQVYDTAQETVDQAATLIDERQRALARLDELLRLNRDLTDRPDGEAPITPVMLRRVIFAAWRQAVAAGAKDEADRMLQDMGHPAPLPGA